MKLKTLLAALILSMIANAGNAQTTTGTNAAWKDQTLSPQERVTAACAAIADPATPAEVVVGAAESALSTRPVLPLVQANPSLADEIIADPTMAGRLDGVGVDRVWVWAIQWKALTLANEEAIPFLQGYLSANILPEQRLLIGRYLSACCRRKARDLRQTGDHAGVIGLLTPVVGWSPAQTLDAICKAKVATRATDALQWAKLYYMACDFAWTQDGINAVCAALKMGGNIAPVNAFIKFQKDGSGADPLADVALPNVTIMGQDPASRALAASISGNKKEALRIAIDAMAASPEGKKLDANVALVAQMLRNSHGCLPRANAYADAQSKSEPFTFSELQ